MIAQLEDPELLEWIVNAERQAGGFLSHFAAAALRADHENYPLLRPLVVAMRQKYPLYERANQPSRI